MGDARARIAGRAWGTGGDRPILLELVADRCGTECHRLQWDLINVHLSGGPCDGTCFTVLTTTEIGNGRKRPATDHEGEKGMRTQCARGP